MSQSLDGARKTYIASETGGANLRWYISDPTTSPKTVSLCDADTPAVGYNEDPVLAADDLVTLTLVNKEGTVKAKANGAVTGGNKVYAADDGEVSANGRITEGVAQESVTADGDILEVMPNSAAHVEESIEGTVSSLTADDSASSLNTIPDQATAVTVGGVTNDANDFIQLPAIANVPVGHTINIIAAASSNFELRTPASSGTTINNVDSDGTQEYLVTDTDMVRITKTLATGWVAQSITNLGAVRTAVVPD